MEPPPAKARKLDKDNSDFTDTAGKNTSTYGHPSIDSSTSPGGHVSGIDEDRSPRFRIGMRSESFQKCSSPEIPHLRLITHRLWSPGPDRADYD